MHIPACDTQKTNILTFDDAMVHDSERADYDRNQWIYIPDFYSEYRYILGTIGKKPLITIGINPSTAEPDHLDNTLKSVSRIAAGNGFDSFIMFNVYAQRATNPSHMDKTFNERLHHENMCAFRWVLEQSEAEPAIWAAWGTMIETRGYLKNCLMDMVRESNRFGAAWYMTGKPSLKGHPHHPLYLKKDSKIRGFDIEEYLKTL